ncbi:MAG: helix-turn-helix transcriptional regulator [Planctomycetaceae bacterium]|nr:helix-turn-helix transcriptional regulator [Planctomycetales bacterium]MCB9941254.1 helix-turn-helix transcriptional regulator [Planctomycetaceae bacterium]
MAKVNEDLSAVGLSAQRLSDLLESLAERGLNQAQVAVKAGLPPQYVSDIKRSRRPMTELVARRLGEEFDVNFQWLMGISNSMENPTPHASTATANSTVWLPLFSHPIEGEPRQHPTWNGAGVEIAGVAAGRIGLTRYPYVLQFGHNDVQGRLRQGDLILISQLQRDEAEIHVVSYRKKSFLARANKDGSWSRVANDNNLPGDCPITGHCIGIVWSALI